MKTFETEKHNIPEGATHYADETVMDYFAWVKFVDGEQWRIMPDSMSLNTWHREDTSNIKPIPQTNIETPEEKVVEWVNGDDVEAYGKPYKYVGLDPFNDNLCICLANQDDDPQCFSIEVLNKPETEAERVKRERLEAAEDLYTTYMSKWEFSQDWEALDEINKSAFLAIVDKTNYRKESD